MKEASSVIVSERFIRARIVGEKKKKKKKKGGPQGSDPSEREKREE